MLQIEHENIASARAKVARGLLHQALKYASRGLLVIPLVGKKPVCIGWQTRASKDPAEVTRLFNQFPNATGIGIVTGSASGVWALDPDGLEGATTLDRLVSRYGGLPRGPVSLTGGGGMHHLFAMPPGRSIRCSTSQLGPKLDVRGDGGFIAAPGSIHPGSGELYRWHATLNGDLPLPQAPGWLVELVTKSAPTVTTAPALPALPATPAVQARAEHFASWLPESISGERGHARLYSEACRLRELRLQDDVALDHLREFNERCLPPWPEKQLLHVWTWSGQETRHIPGIYARHHSDPELSLSPICSALVDALMERAYATKELAQEDAPDLLAAISIQWPEDSRYQNLWRISIKNCWRRAVYLKTLISFCARHEGRLNQVLRAYAPRVALDEILKEMGLPDNRPIKEMVVKAARNLGWSWRQVKIDGKSVWRLLFVGTDKAKELAPKTPLLRAYAPRVALAARKASTQPKRTEPQEPILTKRQSWMVTELFSNAPAKPDTTDAIGRHLRIYEAEGGDITRMESTHDRTCPWGTVRAEHVFIGRC